MNASANKATPGRRARARRPAPGRGASAGAGAAAGFTIIELVVTIAIIALLIAITMPILSSVRAAGRATQCLSNLHQVAAALSNYTSDNHHLFPDIQAEVTWDTLVRPYLADESVLFCPSDTDEVNKQTGVSYDWRSGLRAPFPSTNLWGRDVTTIAQTDLILVFESESARHAPQRLNAADLALAARAISTGELDMDLRRPVR